MQPTVGSDGPFPAEYAIVAEAPGEEEMRQGINLVGPTGQVFWPMLQRLTGLTRDRIRVINVWKRRIGDKEKKGLKWGDWAEERAEVRRELEEAQPRFIITLGRFALQTLLGPDASLEEYHGMPRGGLTGPCVIPCYHPAAGLHEFNSFGPLAWDLEQAARVIEGRAPDADAVVAPHSVIAIDTEGTVDDPWCLTYHTAGEEHAGLVRADDEFQLGRFKIYLKGLVGLGCVVVMHNAIHDIGVLKAMGVDLRAMGARVVDTMILLYELAVEAQGLKVAVRRHLGLEMQDYSDVVEPVQREWIREWLAGAAGLDWPKPEGRKKSMPWRIASLLGSDDGEFMKKWRKWELKDQVMARAGEPPMPRMGDIPGFERYAKRDATMTLALFPVVMERCRGLEVA